MRTFACLAVTLDGKIASAKNPRDRFGSKADLEHLLNTRNQADAILSGGETFRQFSGVRKGSQAGRIPIQCILTRRFQLPPEASLFQKAKTNPLPIIIFSPQPPDAEIRSQYPDCIEWVSFGKDDPAEVILETLRAKGVKTLSIEGGGQVVHLFLKSRALQEMYLTLCPVLLGGKDDPALELYLHLKIHYTD
jgi:5-amino-6-(5-phosphoribosylamino)uracil reductase